MWEKELFNQKLKEKNKAKIIIIRHMLNFAKTFVCNSHRK